MMEILLISKAHQGQHVNVHYKSQMFSIAIMFLKVSMSIVSMLSIVRLFQHYYGANAASIYALIFMKQLYTIVYASSDIGCSFSSLPLLKYLVLD